MGKMSDDVAAIKMGQAVLVQKLDDFMTTQKINHEEQRAYCAAHNAWTGAIQKKLDDHEALKNRAVGAAKIATVAAPLAFAIIRTKLFKWFGIH